MFTKLPTLTVKDKNSIILKHSNREHNTQKKKPFGFFFKMVGMTRFERATPSSQARCATKLRYIPILSFQFFFEKRSLVYLLNGSIEPPALHSPAPLSTCHRHLSNGRPCYIPILIKFSNFATY